MVHKNLRGYFYRTLFDFKQDKSINRIMKQKKKTDDTKINRLSINKIKNIESKLIDYLPCFD